MLDPSAASVAAVSPDHLILLLHDLLRHLPIVSLQSSTIIFKPKKNAEMRNAMTISRYVPSSSSLTPFEPKAMSTNNNAAPPSGSAADGKFDDLISLVMQRSRGEVGNDDIEDAINSIIGAPAAASARKVKNTDTIVPDEGNYDDDDESDSDEQPQKKRTALETKDYLPPDKETKESIAARNEKLEEIPFGKMGERMLVTFGDGTQPHLDVISSALLGTRSCLQRAILDARALHRTAKEQWHQARAAAVMHSSSSVKDQMKKTIGGELSATVPSAAGDSELSFRALSGIDPLRFDTPCGFNLEQLETLFPEEMSAYQRWKKMHKAYVENSADDMKQPKILNDDEDTNTDIKEDTEEDKGDDTIDYGGRLNLRLANFDARTTEMGDDSYLKFADYRKGSFLSKNRGKPTADVKEWKENRQQAPKKRGRPKRTNWQNLHHSCVVFLHWIGFDQRSALSPPNEETTQALGFLAYDFFGKIVEKAVSLRLESTSSKGKARTLFGSEEPILELTGGDQLGVDDIERSLAEVKMNSLYSSKDVELGNSSKIAQLYFGPGFEDRLELEIDEIFGPKKKKKLSAQELERRKDEETLFSGIAAPPTLLSNINDVLLQNNDDELKDEEE